MKGRWIPAAEPLRLPTGSRIAYVRVPAQGPPRPVPVVFVHGGPGVADMAGDAAYFGQLARDGFDVYVYDQAGTGRSARLANPSQYTIARAVADLEAIRARIGAGRMMLIGHSWGAQVAASYLAAHSQHVARAVFSSPGPLAPAADDGSGARLRERLTLGEQLGLYALLARPRVLLAYTLLQVNPQAAHAFAGDAEMDAAMDRVYNQSRAALHCRSEPAGPALHGLGFYAHQFPQSAASRPWADPRPALARLTTPALVIKGGCDYLSWPTALACRQALPHAALACLQQAGHNAYQDQPGVFLTTVRAFLTGPTGQPLPVRPWTHASAPPGDQGPAAPPGRAARPGRQAAQLWLHAVSMMAAPAVHPCRVPLVASQQEGSTVMAHPSDPAASPAAGQVPARSQAPGTGLPGDEKPAQASTAPGPHGAPRSGSAPARPARQYRPGRGRHIENTIMSVLARAGLIPRSWLLTTRGRKTGRPRTNPVVPVDHDGRRWLVAPYGPVSWVHNARAAGRVTLTRRGDTRVYAIREAAPEEAGPILKRYVRIATATRQYFLAAKDSPVEDFAAEADRHPVFELLPAGKNGQTEPQTG